MTGLAFLVGAGLCFARSDDNVFIADGVETWCLLPASGSKPARVKNSIKNVYEATRYKERIRVYTSFNDFWLLDKAVCGVEKPAYDSAPSRNVFHDDNRICYFDIDAKPGKKYKVQFDRTVADAVYFTRIYLFDDYPIRHKKYRIILPPEYSDVTLEELNFKSNEDPRIRCEMETGSDGSKTFVYTVEGMEGIRSDEKRTPHPLRYRPTLLVKGYFTAMQDLFKWQTDISSVDQTIPDVDTFINKDIYGGEGPKLSRLEKLDKIYSWVQTNIRYIAYEEGESGHRPDTPAEVIRKRYGDCKGMAFLLATLLRHEGFEANAAVVGTDDIPYNISDIPSIGSSDHCICVVSYDGNKLFLDATASYIPYDHIPGSIQGKDAIIIPENGNPEECTIIDIPVMAPMQTALDSIRYEYHLDVDANILQGTVSRRINGDMREAYIAHYMSEGQKRSAEYMARSLVPLKRADIPLDRLITENSTSCGETSITAPIVNAEAVTDAGEFLYLDLNANCENIAGRLDSKERIAPYMLFGRGHIVRSSVVELPRGCKITYLPDNFDISVDQAHMTCRFMIDEAGNLEMIKTITIFDPMIPVTQIDAWNNAISKWNNACSRQIEISR